MVITEQFVIRVTVSVSSVCPLINLGSFNISCMLCIFVFEDANSFSSSSASSPKESSLKFLHAKNEIIIQIKHEDPNHRKNELIELTLLLFSSALVCQLGASQHSECFLEPYHHKGSTAPVQDIEISICFTIIKIRRIQIIKRYLNVIDSRNRTERSIILVSLNFTYSQKIENGISSNLRTYKLSI